MYTLKINCKGKRTVRKANKGINVEKYNRFLKIKIIKNRLKNGRRKKKGGKKGKLHRTAKPNVEAEVYNNNRKCD